MKKKHCSPSRIGRKQNWTRRRRSRSSNPNLLSLFFSKVIEEMSYIASETLFIMWGTGEGEVQCEGVKLVTNPNFRQ